MSKSERARRVGIRDIAAAAGVSTTTVSHAFSGARALKPETQQRIIEVAERLGYSPDPRARGLRGARTYTLGFLSDVIATSPHAGRMVSGAQAAAAEHSYVLLVLDSEGIAERELTQIRTLLAHRVDGFVYARMFNQIVDVPDALRGEHVVLADAASRDRELSSIVPDEYDIGRTATETLLDAGHRRIGFATIRDNAQAALGRERGYRDALTDRGITPDESLIVRNPGSANALSGRAAGEALLDRAVRPSAIFAFNDEIAMGLYQSANRRGLRIPHDLSIVGVDDLEVVASGLDPGLTTVALPHYDMGYWAVKHLISAVESNAATQHEIAACPLVERASVASFVGGS